MSNRSATVVGAGLGGLVAALALQRAGWRVRVHEQAAVLGEVGAGISISPGAGRALASLGVGDAFIAASLPVPDVGYLHFRTGALLAGRLVPWPVPDPGPGLARHIHRADLHALLLQAVRAADPDAVLTGQRLVDVRTEGDRARVRFADGSTADCGLLIAADGTQSAVRRLLFDDSPPAFAGQVAYRCLVPRAAAEPFMAAGAAAVTVGPGRIFHRYRLRGGELVNVVGIARSSAWQGEGWRTPATVAEFAAEYDGFHADVQGLIACAPPETLIKWALHARPPLGVWHRGPVTLLGDAAHPILPFLGLGATLAIEDGVLLARTLEAIPDVPSALATFQRLRTARVEAVRLQTILQGELIQSSDPDQGRLGRAPSQDVGLFDHDVLGVPIPQVPQPEPASSNTSLSPHA